MELITIALITTPRLKIITVNMNGATTIIKRGTMRKIVGTRRKVKRMPHLQETTEMSNNKKVMIVKMNKMPK